MFKINQNVCRFTFQALRFNNFSSAPTVAAINIGDEGNETINVKKSRNTEPSKIQNNLVAAAFASLKTDAITPADYTPYTNDRIANAKTVEELLSISEGSGVTRWHALKVVSILAEWSTSGKIELSEFDSDVRFVRLCRILTKGNWKNNNAHLRNEDLSTIINVTADDEAAKLISTITLPQMVKVMSVLAQKRRRSTSLLRSLTYNIAQNVDNLDLKQCADLLYSSAVLNFIDVNFLEKICSDICISLQNEFKGSAVIGSILMSLGILRYKNKLVLDNLKEWILKNHSKCRTQDSISLLITSAILNYHEHSDSLCKILTPEESEINKPSVWLDVVWSLVVLGRAKREQVQSVLSEDFIKSIQNDNQTNTASFLKLLNIDAASELLLKDYRGPRIPTTSEIKTTMLVRSKEKETMVSSVQDSLSNFLDSKVHMKTNVNTSMGFFIDVELALDKNFNPLPINKPLEKSDILKVAILVHNYHDVCRGSGELTGINELFISLLQAQGYKILSIPHTEYRSTDKLVKRVKYLQEKIKTLIF